MIVEEAVGTRMFDGKNDFLNLLRKQPEPREVQLDMDSYKKFFCDSQLFLVVVDPPKREPCDITVADFDNVKFKVEEIYCLDRGMCETHALQSCSYPGAC
jgi:hypothetical protein